MSAGEEGRDIAHNKSQGVQDDPGDDDALQPRPGLVHRPARAGEVHHQQCNGGRHDGGDGGDGEDLGVDVLHHLAGLRPNRISREGRLTEQRGRADAQIGHERAASKVKPAPRGVRRWHFVLFQ